MIDYLKIQIKTNAVLLNKFQNAMNTKLRNDFMNPLRELRLYLKFLSEDTLSSISHLFP